MLKNFTAVAVVSILGMSVSFITPLAAAPLAGAPVSPPSSKPINPALLSTPDTQPTPGQTASLGTSNNSADSKEVGKHGGKVVTHKGRKFEIKVDKKANHLDVYTAGEQKLDKPENLSVLLYKDPDTAQTIRLQPMGTTMEGDYHYRGSYQGFVTPAEAPFVAFGLQFDLSPNPTSTPSAGPQAE